MTVTTNILQRTFRIHHDGGTGTCFTIDVQGRRYLISAKHVVDSIPDDAVVELSYDRGWLPMPVRLVGHGAGDIDVTVLAPQELFGASHALNLTTAGLYLAEDIYFLGFPYGLAMEVKTGLNAGFPLPLVKKAVVSSLGLGWRANAPRWPQQRRVLRWTSCSSWEQEGTNRDRCRVGISIRSTQSARRARRGDVAHI